MAAKPITMNQIRLIFQYLSKGVSQRKIAETLKISRPTIKVYLLRAKELNLDFTKINNLNDEELNNLFIRSNQPFISADHRLVDLYSNLSGLVSEMSKKGVTKRLLWEEYKQNKPMGYEYSQFCYYLQQYQNQKDLSMHILHEPGHSMEVDFTGSKFKCKLSDGTSREYHCFVAILPYSGFSYVQVIESQNQQDFITCIQNALIYFGGVPCQIITDNLKSAVIKSDRYEPSLNALFEQLAAHYHTAIMPTRAAKPKDKASVERMVNLTYQRIFARLRNEVFENIMDVNIQIKKQLDLHHQRKFRVGNQTRKELFELEKTYLQPLCSDSFIIKKQLQAKVHKNYHVTISEDGHAYSVPFQYVGQSVQVVYTDMMVEIYHSNKRIASHQRNYNKNRYTTIKNHMPEGHQFYSEQKGWDSEFFKKWAFNISEDTLLAIEKILSSRQYIEQSYKACIGILTLEKKVGKVRLSNACKLALQDGYVTYKRIKIILDNKRDLQIGMALKEDPLTLIMHENIRNNYK